MDLALCKVLTVFNGRNSLGWCRWSLGPGHWWMNIRGSRGADRCRCLLLKTYGGTIGGARNMWKEHFSPVVSVQTVLLKEIASLVAVTPFCPKFCEVWWDWATSPGMWSFKIKNRICEFYVWTPWSVLSFVLHVGKRCDFTVFSSRIRKTNIWILPKR